VISSVYINQVESDVKYILSLAFILMAFKPYAAEIFPRGCKPLVVKDELLTLVAEQPTLVMVHNISTTDLWMTHPVSHHSANAGWTTQLQSGQWSALVYNEKTFDLSCIESRPGHEQQVPCAGLLAACEWSNFAMPKTESGNFWVGENLTLTALMAHVGSRGYILPVPAQ